MKEKGTNVNTVKYRDEFVKRLTGLVQDYKSTYYDATLSDKKFCDIVGLSYETYKAWKTTFTTDAFVEKYARYPKYDSLIFLAELFGVSIDYLTLRDAEKSPHHKELNLTIKEIANILKLKEDVVLALMTPYTNSATIKVFLNYFLKKDKETLKLYKKIIENLYTKKDSKENTILLDKLHAIEKKDYEENNANYNKLEFLHNTIRYIFYNIDRIEDFKGNHILGLNLLDHKGLSYNLEDLNPKDYESTFLVNINKNLNTIKDLYNKNEYEKDVESSLKGKIFDANIVHWNTTILD